MVSKMFVLGRVIALVVFFTAFLQSEVHAEKIEHKAEIVESIKSLPRAKRFLYPEQAILAGESTPVFVAVMDNGKRIYYRLRPDAVKCAIDHFKSNRFHGQRRRSVDDTINLVESLQPDHRLNRSERNAYEKTKFYYPSLLVVVDRRLKWPLQRRSRLEVIYDDILYALAYWNEVEIQLRRIQNPGVRIRIAAIVISKQKAAFPTTLEYHDGWGYSMYYTLPRILQYWQDVKENHKQFSGFNVVATMTDTTVPPFTGYGASARFSGCGNYFSGYTGHLRNITGLMVNDNGSFDNIQQAVAEMSHIMGRSDTGRGASVDASSFTKGDLKEIKEGLQEASCWKDPIEIYPPGKPVQRLYRTDLYRP